MCHEPEHILLTRQARMAPCPRPYWLHGQDGVSKKHDDEVAKTLGVSSGPERTTPLPRCVEVGSLTAAGGAAEHASYRPFTITIRVPMQVCPPGHGHLWR